MTKNEIACCIADVLVARGATGRAVPGSGTLGDLLRDYERASVAESLAEPDGPDDCDDPRYDLAPDRHEVPALDYLAEVRL